MVYSDIRLDIARERFTISRMPSLRGEHVILLARIQQLWTELRRSKEGTPRHEALEAEIRRDADAFRATGECPTAKLPTAS